MSVPAAQLSCQQCQRRKTKCDKEIPTCSACLKAGIVCNKVQRHRLPRGRTSKKVLSGPALGDRIDRLEAIVSQLQHKLPASGQAAAPDSIIQDQHGSAPGLPTAVDSFVAPDFWTELTETVAGLRSVLEDPDAVEDFDDVDGPSWTSQGMPSSSSSSLMSPSTATPADPNVILFGPKIPFTYVNPTQEMKERFLNVYQARIDTIFKVTHWPSTSSLIRFHDQSDCDSKPLAANVKALASAVYFTATCSLMDHELDSRQAIVEQYRQTAEDAFVHAGLLTTKSFITLQAFVIYLAGLRACQANAQQWALIAIAIRLASAQGIPASAHSNHSPLEAELRRRLWFSIGVLDLQSAFDRGSQTLLTSGDFGSWPLNISDTELSSQSTSSPSAQKRFTSMSFSLLVYRAGICQRKLTEIGSSAADGNVDPIMAGHEQVAILADYERHIRQIPGLCDAPPSPIQSFTLAVAEESLVAMRLLLYRPLHRRGNGNVPSEYGPAGKFDLLATANEVLERSQNKRSWTDFAQWAWFSWVKWYALAVVLTELCTAQGALADRAWDVAQRSYDDYATIVADSNSGLLWKPIMKLMRKVKQVREEQQRLAQQQKGIQNVPTFAAQQYWSSTADANSMFSTPEAPSSAYPSEYMIATGDSTTTMYDQQLRDANMQGSTDEAMSWLQWDLLINDINDSSIHNE